MHFWLIVIAAVVIAALILWGVSSLNPHAFASAAKTAEANAGAGLTKDATSAVAAAGAAAQSAVSSIGRAI